MLSVSEGTSTTDECPLLVHCGTGVSRTGVFIAVDYSLMKAKHENCVNVYRFVAACPRAPCIILLLLQFYCSCDPLPSNRQHLSYDVCLEVRGEIIRTGLCCIVY